MACVDQAEDGATGIPEALGMQVREWAAGRLRSPREEKEKEEDHEGGSEALSGSNQDGLPNGLT